MAQRPLVWLPSAQRAFGWTGFYVGVHGGYGGSTADVDVAASGVTIPPFGAHAATATMVSGVPTDFATNAKGFIGGGTLGYNVQTGRFVWGVETDLSWADIEGTNSQSGVFPGIGGAAPITTAGTVQEKLDAFGTLRGRLGFAPDGRLLIYATGGLAYGHVASNTNISEAFPPSVLTPISGGIGSASQFRVGWTAGAGVEYAFAPHWSVKAEYLYYDLGTLTYNSVPIISPFGGTPSASIGVKSSAEFDGSIVRAGINYKFW